MSSGWLIINSGSDNGQMYTNTVSYNANGQMGTAWFDIADSYLSYNYYSDNTGGDSNQALQSTTLYPPNDQGAVTTSYTYDSSTKRLSTITVNGIVFSFDYQNGSNQINHIYAVPVGGSTNVTDRFSQDTTDPARIAQQVVSANGNALTETVPAGGYNQQDQITGQTITRENSSGSSQTDLMGYGYNANNADALTSVSDTAGGTTTIAGFVGRVVGRTAGLAASIGMMIEGAATDAASIVGAPATLGVSLVGLAAGSAEIGWGVYGIKNVFKPIDQTNMMAKGDGPTPNDGDTDYLHGGAAHDAAIEDYIENRIPKGADEIRKNQAQVDADGNVVGNNRPDIQYDYDGEHYVVEIDNNPGASNDHAVQIRRNDPNAHVTQIGLGK